MAKKDIYDWPEGEDDNIDFDAIHEQNKNKTVEDLDREWEVMPYTLTKEEEKFWLSQPDEITIPPIEEIEKNTQG